MTPLRQLLAGALVILSLLGLAAALLYLQRPALPVPDAQLVVATTIFPLADIVQNVAGDHARVLQLLPSGASEHDYALSPQQLSELERADALFVVGYGLDDWATRSLRRNLTIPVITVNQDIALHPYANAHAHDDEHTEEATETIDPHYWLTVPNGQTIAANIAGHLAELDPAHATDYQRNLATYQRELSALEQELQAIARRAPRREFIAVHDAWSYLAPHYGFELVSTYEPIEGQVPSLADLQELQQLVRAHNLATFYTEPQKQSSSAIRFMRDELGLTIKVLDPVGGPPPYDSYANLMRANVASLATP